MSYICVAIGGAIGSLCRFGLSNITTRFNFPLMTFIINLLGALLIGFIVGLGEKKEIPNNVMLLIKVGFCGGFTTFSTFSLETLDLIQSKHIGLAIVYAGVSLVLCVAGVFMGNVLAKRIF